MSAPRVVMVGAVGAGGHARYCATLADAVRSTGAEVQLIGPQYPSPWYTRFRAPRYLDRSIRHWLFVRKLLTAVSHSRPEVVHFQSVLPIMDQLWFPWLRKMCKVVITVHNVDAHVQSLAFDEAFERRLLCLADALIVHSPGMRRALSLKHPGLEGRTIVVRHGVWKPAPIIGQAAARAALGLSVDRNVVLFFGALRENKGLGLLLEALALLKRQRPAASPLAVIAGRLANGATFAKYERMIDALGLRQDVDVRLGFIPDELVSAYYAACDVVALPYDEAFKAQSGVLLETYGHGRPVVVTHAGALAETVLEDGTGWIAEARTPEAYARALGEALWNKAAVQLAVSRMAKLRAEKYDWTRVGVATRLVYDRLRSRNDLDRLGRA